MDRAHQLGTITGVSGTSVLVVVDGSTEPITLKRLGSYTTPAVGHRVLIAAVLSGDRVVEGYIVP